MIKLFDLLIHGYDMTFGVISVSRKTYLYIKMNKNKNVVYTV